MGLAVTMSLDVHLQLLQVKVDDQSKEVLSDFAKKFFEDLSQELFI